MAEICIYDGCYKHAWYNYPNETEKLYCKEHYKPDMVFKYFYICIDENCNRCAYYNTSDKMKKPEYCSMHKKDDMINVLTNRCIEEGCVKFPSFNFKTEKVSIYCSEHAHPNMINVHKARCKFISENGERCYNNPLWNFPNKTGLMYCKEHKEDGMICKTYQICAMDHCSKSASHNYKYEEGRLYCAEHALKGMINKKHATCIIDNCEKLASYNYKGNKRPDFTFDMTTHMVILEVDEYQHSKYIKECENVRMYNITQSLGGIPVIWIRYNPDIYMVGNNKINTPDRYRHATLIEYLTKFVKDKPKNLAEVIYLYYNEYQKDNNKRITLIENES